MKNTLIKIVCVVGLFCSCREQIQEKTNPDKKTVNISELPYDASANTTTDNPFQDSVSNLQRLWMDSEKAVYLERLSAIALKSDGENSEYMNVALVDMFKSNPAPLIAYLNKNKKSPLYGTLADGLSLEICVYSKEERVAKKNQIKEDAIKLSSGKLTKSQLAFMDQLFKDVKPERFD